MASFADSWPLSDADIMQPLSDSDSSVRASHLDLSPDLESVKTRARE
jgi:hypothetical protein